MKYVFIILFVLILSIVFLSCNTVIYFNGFQLIGLIFIVLLMVFIFIQFKRISR